MQLSTLLPCVIITIASLQYINADDTFTTSIPTTTTISPTGLIYGLLAVAVVQIFLTLPYYYLLRHSILQRPFVQKKRPETKTKPFFSGLLNHLAQPEGFVLLGGYLISTWMFNLMPASYYNLNRTVLTTETLTDVLLQLLLNDLYQTVAHLLEHKISSVYKKAHKPHHKFKSPILFDAFDGNYVDTICMILIPLYTTCMTLSLCGRNVSVWSYMIFGSIYANYLCLIHSEYEHVWDKYLHRIGIAVAADHHIHHRLFNYNFGHLFTFWDRLFGTYRSPYSYPQYFSLDGMITESKKSDYIFPTKGLSQDQVSILRKVSESEKKQE